MKKILFAVLVLLSSKSLYAQEAEDVGWVARFGAAGGFTPTYFSPNINPVNALIKNLGIEQSLGSGVITFGGGGYAYIMLVDNLRIGGLGLSGSTSAKGTSGGFDKEVIYNYGLGGLTVEYTLPFINKIAVSVGTIIGGGSASIEIYKNRDDFDWNIIGLKSFDNFPPNDENLSRKYTNVFFTITPTLNVDIPLDRFIAFRVGGGYIFSFNNEWNVDNDKTLRNVPSDMKSNSFFIQTGIFFGLIAF